MEATEDENATAKRWEEGLASKSKSFSFPEFRCSVGPFESGLFGKSHAVRLLGLDVTVGFVPIITETALVGFAGTKGWEGGRAEGWVRENYFLFTMPLAVLL